MRKNPEFHGPRTWALAREASLSGETARAVSERFGITVGAIRARINREGWTRDAHAIAVENARLGPPPEAASGPAMDGEKNNFSPTAFAPGRAEAPDALPLCMADPGLAVKRSLRAASCALAEGRAVEAQALIKAAEGVARLYHQVGPLPLPEAPEDGALRREQGLPGDPDVFEAFMDEVWQLAGLVARELVAPEPEAPAVFARTLYRWRERHLGPKVAARDRERIRAGGFADQLYDADGRLLPAPTVAECYAAYLRDRDPARTRPVKWAVVVRGRR